MIGSRKRCKCLFIPFHRVKCYVLENYKTDTNKQSLLEFLRFFKHKSAFVTKYGNGETEIFQVKQTSHEPNKDVLSEKWLVLQGIQKY